MSNEELKEMSNERQLAFNRVKSELNVNIDVTVSSSVDALVLDLKRRKDDIVSAALAVGLRDREKIIAALPPLPLIDEEAELDRLKQQFPHALLTLWQRGEKNRVRRHQVNGALHFYLITKTLKESTTPKGTSSEYVVLREDLLPMKLGIDYEFRQGGTIIKVGEAQLKNPSDYGLSPEQAAQIINDTITEV